MLKLQKNTEVNYIKYYLEGEKWGLEARPKE